ncbi:DNA polymerase III subunit delta' [Coxiella-like endosymbiont of Amblyomma americanum]|uniref:DNA polymerase III subunit delta' n=1 Tax=Coxiella-like endosymbiont of Amblyomma americanum TaxID=1987500 RepID=UPI000F89D856|nr:DNA polymerase III subunit delta' [Coxiella-like endosymbiont of Amblyomma americanum]AUJ58988.1 hypothetical protein B1F76_02960 [Coxiella-like endosymbiont of Amblyomma americanum]
MIYPWQQKQWDIIVSYYQKECMPHALLLTGNRGLGKLIFAQSVAELILCERNTTQACKVCRDCQLFRLGHHPDLFIIDIKEKNSSIEVAQIREITAALNKTSQRGRCQVVILTSVEAMNISATNAFLKTLEEPLGPVLLMLVTHRVAVLPQTVRSRCQRIVFTASSDQNMLRWVKARIREKSKASQLLALAYHAPLEAIKLEMLNYFPLRDCLLILLINTITQRTSVVDVVKFLLKEDTKLILYIITTIFMDVLRLQIYCPDFVLNTDCFSILQKFSLVLSRDKLLTILQKLQEIWQVTVSLNSVNSQLLLEELFLMLETQNVS